ncbi:MAG: tetratricopeptide repeat protein [Candidatus Brocadiia bacterium]
MVCPVPSCLLGFRRNWTFPLQELACVFLCEESPLWQSEEARAYLKRLYDPKYRDYRWAADGIFRVGTWMQNEMQDAEAAMPHWEHVFTHNPEHPEAERSLFYYGIMAMHRQQYAKAKKAFTEYLRRYPDSRWTERVRTKLLPKANRLTKESER